MFRNDVLSVQREVYEVIEGEAVYKDKEIILENIPCHLSVSLNNPIDVHDIPSFKADFTLFLDYFPNLDIKTNDILLIKTSKNQEYKLFAGDIKIYSLSVQIKCRQEKVVES